MKYTFTFHVTADSPLFTFEKKSSAPLKNAALITFLWIESKISLKQHGTHTSFFCIFIWSAKTWAQRCEFLPSLPGPPPWEGALGLRVLNAAVVHGARVGANTSSCSVCNLDLVRAAMYLSHVHPVHLLLNYSTCSLIYKGNACWRLEKLCDGMWILPQLCNPSWANDDKRYPRLIPS